MATNFICSYLSSVYPAGQMALWLKAMAGDAGKAHHGHHNGTHHNGTTNGTSAGHHGHNSTASNATVALNATQLAAAQLKYTLAEIAAGGFHNWTIMNINQFPTGVQAVSAVSLLLSTSLCMVYPVWIIITVVQFVLLFAIVSLRVWRIPMVMHCKSTWLNKIF